MNSTQPPPPALSDDEDFDIKLMIPTIKRCMEIIKYSWISSSANTAKGVVLSWIFEDFHQHNITQNHVCIVNNFFLFIFAFSFFLGTILRASWNMKAINLCISFFGFGSIDKRKRERKILCLMLKIWYSCKVTTFIAHRLITTSYIYIFQYINFHSKIINWIFNKNILNK